MNAPYQRITTTDDVIKVHAQPPSAYGVSCDKNPIEVEMYHIYLREYDNSQQTYFDGLSKMITVEGIRAYGRKVYAIEGRFKYGRLYSSYRGTGEVFAIIATYSNRSSAYVPAVSYGCEVLNWDTDCVGPGECHLFDNPVNFFYFVLGSDSLHKISTRGDHLLRNNYKSQSPFPKKRLF